MVGEPKSGILVVTRAEDQLSGFSAAAADLAGVTPCRAGSIGAAERLLQDERASPFDLVVLGPDLEQPLLAARRVRRASPVSQILIVQRKQGLERLATMLAFLPDLSGAWTIEAEAGQDRVRAIMAEAVQLSRGRRDAASLSAKLNRALANANESDEAKRRHRRLALSQSFFGAVLSQAADPIFAADMRGNLLNWNEAATALFGPRPEESAAYAVPLPEAWRQALNDLLQRAATGEQASQRELRLPRADGDVIDLSVSMAPVRDEQGQVACISVVARDISERKQSEERQRLLVRELNHRVKNTVALVQALARRSAQNTTSVPDFLAALNGRLEAMSAAHGLLSASWWQGVLLTDLVQAVLFPHVRDGRMRLDIEAVQLAPELASSLALVFNELGTNATKYGALSNADGQVQVFARMDPGARFDQSPRQLKIEWREMGGPPVASPQRGGFGTRLLTQLISYQHQGDVQMEWSEAGLVCSLMLPLQEAQPQAPAA